MTTRIKRLLAGLTSDTTDHEVHFHTGPDALPAVCFDRGCSTPRLEV